MGSSGVLQRDPARIGSQDWWCGKSPFSPGGRRLTTCYIDRRTLESETTSDGPEVWNYLHKGY